MSIENIIEIAAVKLNSVHEQIIIVGLYRCPSNNSNVNFQTFFETLQETLLICNGCNCFVIGDFNINVLQKGDGNTRELSSIMEDCYFFPLFNEITRPQKEKDKRNMHRQCLY